MRCFGTRETVSHGLRSTTGLTLLKGTSQVRHNPFAKRAPWATLPEPRHDPTGSHQGCYNSQSIFPSK